MSGSRNIDFLSFQEIFDRLYNEFTVKSPVGSILIVNTMGWIIGKK